ncbi:MAG TPA: hypothetical protein PLV85_22535, partial [Polyangiaceae bacterium]|nr:hypothetical protein [Polyangiaceae bacterium]
MAYRRFPDGLATAGEYSSNSDRSPIAIAIILTLCGRSEFGDVLFCQGRIPRTTRSRWPKSRTICT